MKKMALIALFTAFSATAAQADTWAFDSKDKVVGKVGAVLVEVQEQNPSWTFCEADATYLVTDYESHTFN